MVLQPESAMVGNRDHYLEAPQVIRSGCTVQPWLPKKGSTDIDKNPQRDKTKS